MCIGPYGENFLIGFAHGRILKLLGITGGPRYLR